MISWANTLKRLRSEIDSMIERLGEETPVSCAHTTSEGEFLDNVGVQIEWVCIDVENGLIIGDEANNTEMNLKPGQINAVKLS